MTATVRAVYREEMDAIGCTRAAHVAFTLLVVLPGCGASYGLRGQVAASAPCDRPTSAAEPLAGVRVSLFCPNVTSRDETTTDKRGTFTLLKGKKLDGNCEVILEKAGYETRRYLGRDLCASQNNDGKGPYCGVATELLPVSRSEAVR
jgi:hypothetical protein